MDRSNPAVAISLNNLAENYCNFGNYAKAEPLYQRALQINEQALGPDHPDTLVPLYELAVMYSKTHRKEEAMAWDSFNLI
mgnify:CR=1 FL=1